MVINGNLIIQIREILAPKVSELVADSIIRVNCKRMGIAPEELDVKRSAEMAEKIATSLLLFLNEEDVKEVVNQIKNIRK